MTATQLTRHAILGQQHPPRVYLRERGFQSGFGALPGRMLYDVIGGDYMIGSTVTKETMIERGFKVEVVK